MPAHPLPLKPKEPAKRPAGIADELWYFPRNLADHANAANLSPKQVAAMGGVSPSMITRWMQYDEGSLEALPVAVVTRLEAGMGLPRGTLTTPPAPFAAKRGA